MARLHRRMARLHTQSDITVTYHVFAWGFTLPSLRLLSSWVSFSRGRSFLSTMAAPLPISVTMIRNSD